MVSKKSDQTNQALLSHVEAPPLEHVTAFQRFIHHDLVGSVLLLVAAVIAIVLANSGLSDAFHHLLETPLGVTAGGFQIIKGLHHWVNDGLMCIFFFFVGLEIKRELIAGELVTLRKALLPVVGAVGGIVCPALIFTFFNQGGPGVNGWGIPIATDIAFAAGCLTLLKSSIPKGLFVFLVALAIVDDLGAVSVIAIFYTDTIDKVPLMIGSAFIFLSFVMGLLGVRKTWPYAFVGILIWFAFLNSGVHATIAGVMLAFTVPPDARYVTQLFHVRVKELLKRFVKAEEEWKDYGTRGERLSKDVQVNERQQELIRAINEECHHVEAPLQRIQLSIEPLCILFILPLFALCNTGVQIEWSSISKVFMEPVTLGVFFGLLLGKPIGITVSTWIAVRLGFAELPSGVTWGQMIGVGMLAGIGFTMSLFINSLAFEGQAPEVAQQLITGGKVGILFASTLAAVGGILVLKRVSAPIAREAATTSH